MFPIVIGMVKGETRPGPRASSTRELSWIVAMPPMPEPIETPARSRSSFASASPAESAASRAAATASAITRSRRRASLPGTSPRSSSSGASPPKRTEKPSVSKRRSGPMPERPASAASQVEAASPPSGDTQPRPVTTTRRLGVGIGSVGLELLPEVGDDVAEGLELLGVVLGDLDSELLLHRHHELDEVERIGAEVVGERRLRVDVVPAHAELLDHDLRHPLLQLHLTTPSDGSLHRPCGSPPPRAGDRRPSTGASSPTPPDAALSGPRRRSPRRRAPTPRPDWRARARGRSGARGP